MKSNIPPNPPSKPKSAGQNSSPPNLLPVSSDSSTPAQQNGSAGPVKTKRDCSWQVAPNLWISFKYAWAGLVYAFRTQRNFRIHVLLGSVAIGLGFFLQRSHVEMAVIGLTIGAVLAMELINTALESVVDLAVQQSYHELAKIAKDCAAGAVLVSAFAAILVAGSILLPPLLLFIQGLPVK
ncbi:diacylglycerol kinase family protein [Ancylothrix sp. C2]|uniref:diacylglycerol kinase family protein n=1 Tax=Ancylothrix sp. D3o TaxID=2953691 RepID=UPI0021BB60CB|nr:diacylglycerol kinase family protein [Ancylothrix sp. D3o]MCT7952611.1 diacylglycerol kinase family protein [Ancylothrix sp. D3o]